MPIRKQTLNSWLQSNNVLRLPNESVTTTWKETLCIEVDNGRFQTRSICSIRRFSILKIQIVKALKEIHLRALEVLITLSKIKDTPQMIDRIRSWILSEPISLCRSKSQLQKYMFKYLIWIELVLCLLTINSPF